MPTEYIKRKLAAILSADVKGYSRLMSQDERGTIRTLTAYKEAMSSLIQEYKGRVVDAPGDNLLAEFASVVDAVNCAVEIQRELAERNSELPYNRRMEFRIGINIGDIVEEEKRIYGDGVNIAARMESLAEAGGICISGKVHEEVKNKLGLEYEFLGAQEVKNIAEAVPVYRVLSFPGAAAHRVTRARRLLKRAWLKTAIAAIVVLVIAAVAFWNFYLSRPPIEQASVEKMAYPLPDKPSIAVLPFVNMSGDPEQDYFSDGITEEIITALSKNPRLFVIARNSTFTYKGKAVKVQQVSEDLGVRYVLEGSIQKAGDRIRITAQLIDAMTGNHLWAERYDRQLKDIFALQDEITLKILRAIGLKITYGESARPMSEDTKNLDAYLKVIEGTYYAGRLNLEDRVRAKKLFREAIALDPDYPVPYVRLGMCNSQDVIMGTTKSPKESIIEASKLAQKALDMDDTYWLVHYLLGHIHFVTGQYEKAIPALERSLELNPNSSASLFLYGRSLAVLGKPQKAIRLFHKALRVDPLNSWLPNWGLGATYLQMGRYEEAINYIKKSVGSNPKNIPILAQLAYCYFAVGREEAARTVAWEILNLNPKFSVKKWIERYASRDQALKDRIQAGLLKAGLPE